MERDVVIPSVDGEVLVVYKAGERRRNVVLRATDKKHGALVASLVATYQRHEESARELRAELERGIAEAKATIDDDAQEIADEVMAVEDAAAKAAAAARAEEQDTTTAS